MANSAKHSKEIFLRDDNSAEHGQGGYPIQSKRQSLIESIANVTVGYLVACASQIVILPMFGCRLPVRDNFIIGLWFTAISIVRSYLLRRYFNRRHRHGQAAGQ